MLVAFVPRKRTVRRLAVLSAAIVIAFQLTVNCWFYAYVVAADDGGLSTSRTWSFSIRR